MSGLEPLTRCQRIGDKKAYRMENLGNIPKPSKYERQWKSLPLCAWTGAFALINIIQLMHWDVIFQQGAQATFESSSTLVQSILTRFCKKKPRDAEILFLVQESPLTRQSKSPTYTLRRGGIPNTWNYDARVKHKIAVFPPCSKSKIENCQLDTRYRMYWNQRSFCPTIIFRRSLCLQQRRVKLSTKSQVVVCIQLLAGETDVWWNRPLERRSVFKRCGA